MASPVSFGDAAAMAKIAWRIANAFKQGQKSAPAEFREVENQLYSLSAALVAFKDICGPDLASVTIDPSELPARFQKEEQNGVRSVAGILDSCRETLKHLEKTVDSYSVVTAAKDPTKSRLQRWRTELLRNYKKIAWTTENGDLAALRSQLMVHTNSLDLVLGIIVSSRTTRIEDGLNENSAMLREIHSWWAHNLKDAVTAPREPVQDDNPQGTLATCNPVSFEVHLVSDGVSQLLCPEVCLQDDWRETGSTRLFECRCSQTASHRSHSSVENIALSPLSFPFRQPGDAVCWTLFKALDKSTNHMVSITIKGIAASDIVEFEQTFIQPLADARANAMLHQGISNQLAHLSPDATSVRALNLQSDLRGYHKLIESVTFRVGHRNLSEPYVDGLSLLNYRELGHQIVRSTRAALDHAELSVYYGGDKGAEGSTDMAKSIIHLTQATVLEVEKDNACLVVRGVECLGYNQDQQVSRLAAADVAFQMISSEAASKLHERLEEMRMELFIGNLQYPRPNETIVLHLQAAQAQCEVAIISDAELLITRDHRDQYRLIVTSRNKCTVLTQVLPSAFFTSSSSSEPSFAAPTWLVQLEASGKRKVYHYPDGFRFLSFRDTNAEKMFELGRTAVLQGAGADRTLPVR